MNNYFLFRQGQISMTDLARNSGVSYNTMKKYSKILENYVLTDDEYYTSMECVEDELRRYVDYFKDKTIYCPCDADWSNIPKWLKENTEATVINTWDDCFTHDDLFRTASVIITNPPFSSFKNTFDYFASFKKDMFIVFPLNSLGNKYFNDMIIKGELFMDKPCQKFTRPDGSIKELFATWVTNIDPKKFTKEWSHRALCFTRYFFILDESLASGL